MISICQLKKFFMNRTNNFIFCSICNQLAKTNIQLQK